jgi:hypothetical protein
MLQPAAPLGHRRRFSLLSAIAWFGALVLVIGVAVTGREVGGTAAPVTPAKGPPSAAITPAPSSPPSTPQRIIEPNARIGLVHGPMGVTVGFDRVWVVSAADLRLRRIDPATERVTVIDLPYVPPSLSATPLPTASGETAFATIAGGLSPAGHDLLPLVAVGEGVVWVLGVPAPDVLIGVDPVSGRILGTIRLPAPGTGVVSGSAGTWVTTDAGLLIGIDVGRGTLGPTVRLGPGRVAAASGTTTTWVSSSDGRILRLDRHGRVTAHVNGGGGGPIAVDASSVWVRSGQALIQIDEGSGRSIARSDIATSDGASIAWALPSIVGFDYGDSVARVAPREGWVADVVGTIWLCRPDLGELWRIQRPG